MTQSHRACSARIKGTLAAIVLALGVSSLAGCPSPAGSEWLDVSTLPPNVQSDYAVFAQRCSKCHSLARPLESGITSDQYWREYVARMRHQPGSGISSDDEVVILRFLHFYSVTEQQKKGSGT